MNAAQRAAIIVEERVFQPAPAADTAAGAAIGAATNAADGRFWQAFTAHSFILAHFSLALLW